MTIYINSLTNDYPLYEGDLKVLFPDFVSTSETPWPPGIKPVTVADYTQVSYNPEIEQVKPNLSQDVDGTYHVNWTVERIPEEIVAANQRKKRNELLVSSDWTRLDDAPVNKTAWATYRQKLRDISKQSGFPWDVKWPTKPE